MGRGWFLVCLSIVGIVFLGLYASLWPSFDSFNAAIDHCAEPFCDFVDVYHPMGESILQTGRPVEGFYYSPLFALVLKPFALLPLGPATFLWGALQIPVSLLLMAAPFALMGGKRNCYALLSAVLFLSCYAVLHNFKWGQVSALITALVLFALWMSLRGRSVAAGVLLALAAAIKFYPALFVSWFALKLDWRVLLAFVLTCVLLLGLLPVTILGWQATRGFYGDIGESVAWLAEHHGDINSQAAPSVAWRWTTVFSDPHKVARAFPEFIHLAVLALGAHPVLIEQGLKWFGFFTLLMNGLMVLGLWRREGRSDPLWFFCLAALSFPYVVPTAWPHYFVFLPFCQIFILSELLGNDRAGRWRTVIALLTWIPAVALVNIGFFHHVGSWRIYNGLGAIFVSVVLLNLCGWLVLGDLRD